jgi:tetratricopeptide (TPR) repeat protein
MEVRLREAFSEYGIDLETTDRDEIARRIRESDLAPMLADGLELWIATVGQLGTMGSTLHTKEELLAWMEVVYAADPDPFRTAIRKQIASGRPDIEVLRTLRDSPAFEQALPRTLAWLGTAFFIAGDVESMDAVFRKALVQHQNDLMLNFDYGLHLKMLERWDEAAGYFHAALGQRETGGLWRSFGVALRESGRLDVAITAFEKSVAYEPGYAATYVDLGLALDRYGDSDGALEAYRDAVEAQPDHAEANCRLGLALQEKGRLVDALLALERGHKLGERTPGWDLPSDEWIRECLRLIEARLDGRQ